ncbi:Epidermal retinol dehydrogenase 2 [Trichoplax sp. H2]|nr:Epidermal retinol dehydrogenase 2 [Trichoplax sp. H2]|eukprot:RDD40510.1 Epidermal retinol dehydrogenase 2 [Trichoplax sp. H2]
MIRSYLSISIAFFFVCLHCIAEILRSIWQWVFPIRPKSLHNEIIVITGAGRGLGKALALETSKLGAIVVIWDIDSAANQSVACDIRNSGGIAYDYTIDITNKEAVYATAEAVLTDIGPVSLLINNAGVVNGKTLINSCDSKIEKTLNVNMVSHFWTIKAFLPSMMAKNHGHIVGIASQLGFIGAAGLVDYCCSKFAVLALVDSLRDELWISKFDGVHCTCVCPFLMDTGLFHGITIRFPTLFTAIKADDAAKYIIDGIRRNKQYVTLPKLLYLGTVLKSILPVPALNELLTFVGMHDAMKTFQGH